MSENNNTLWKIDEQVEEDKSFVSCHRNSPTLSPELTVIIEYGIRKQK